MKSKQIYLLACLGKTVLVTTDLKSLRAGIEKCIRNRLMYYPTDLLSPIGSHFGVTSELKQFRKDWRVLSLETLSNKIINCGITTFTDGKLLVGRDEL